ncbi:DUF5666 domain-containing protein [Rhodohalobacter sp. 614A]|uniref:DUF5666 domain-containing protein n=1 Tax=Rhodohalobacter sp. 614A TaxID=2908649 RepID=UPI001F262E1A|nr:DUF5666 domain-containing protein [Rhodohalobacter sp. 614A]
MTDEELEVAGQIIAESLSDEKDGIFASLNDAFTLPSNNNLSDEAIAEKYASPIFVAANKENSSNSESNYNYSYNPESGVHLINISRTIDNENLSKESNAELQYIYYANDGSFIYSPRLESDRIEMIEYIGTRSGSIVTTNKISTYERHDQFSIEGLTASDGIISISGTHEGNGEYKVTRDNGDTIERSYTLTVEFLDVKINNQLVSTDGSLQKGVEGALAYEMFISKNVNGNESMKTINGTIEFNGDGTALLRFQNALDNFKVKLEEGDLLADNEFAGFVRSVNTDGNGRFTLFDDEIYLFNADTQVDPDGDLTSLDEVLAALGTSIRIKAEGSFTDNTDGAHIVQTVKFEYEDEDLEFEDFVETVDVTSNSITLANETFLYVNDETIYDSDGDLTTLAGVLWALDNKFKVKAEGELVPGEEDSLIVTDVKFEFEGNGFEFAGDVQSANPDEKTFTLADGQTYVINENTIIHEKSDLDSLHQVTTVLSEGGEVEAEGEYTPQPDGTWLVSKVNFKSDDFEDDDNGNVPETLEFEGEVNSADASAKTIVVSGVTYHILKSTEFDDHIQSLGNLAGALQRGDNVYVNGEFFNDGEKNIAVKLEFKVDRKGDDEDDDEEEPEEFDFKADVTSVNLSSKTFVLSGGLTLQVNDDTKFDDDNLNSLEEVANALTNGNSVQAKGKYFIDESDNNIVIKVEFETDDDNEGDDDGDDENSETGEFEGKIRSSDLAENSFELTNGRVYFLDGNSIIENDGDLLTFQEVEDALDTGDNVKAEGEYYSEDGDTYIVVSVKFEVEEDDDGDDGDDDNGDEDPEKFDFEGVVSSATSSSFILNGETFFVNGNTNFKGKDVSTMQELIDALNDDNHVEAEGNYYIENGDNIVIKVEFKVEENDEDNDDGDDDENKEEFKFEGIVNSATSSSFVIDGETFLVNDDTKFRGNDIRSMQELTDALNNGDDIEAKGEYYIENGNNVVKGVKFDIDKKNNNGNGGDDSEEEFDFEGIVSSAGSSSFVIEGESFTVTENSKIDGDFDTIQELADALNNGDEVDAKGEYYVNDSDENIVIEVEFESEGNDD